MSTDTKPAIDPFAGLPGIFKDCSDPRRDARFALYLPAVQGGYVYATDGRVIVRKPWDGQEPSEWTAMREGRFPRDVAAFFLDNHEATETPIPPDMHRDPVPCRRCNGSGQEDCEECFGDSDYCDDCDGSGQTECYWCDGVGSTEHEDYEEPVQIGRLRFGRALLAMLQKHGVTGLYLPSGDDVPTRRTNVPGENGRFATKFVLGDVEGRLMPMSSDS